MTNQTGLRWAPFLLGVCALGFLLFRFGPYFQDGSPDYILHFTLIDEIMRSGGVAPDAESRISVMALYPPVSHWMAALIGWVSGSGLVGISLVSISAVFLSYLIAVRLVADTPIKLALFLAAFLVLSQTFSLVGWEIVSSFFYPQLVGDAFYFLALLLLVRAERLSHRAAVFIVMGTVTMWVQPINALHIVAAGCVVLAIEGIKFWRERKAFPLHYAAASLSAVMIAGITLALNPELKLMQQISANNGALEFWYTHIMLAAALCAIVCAANAWRYIFKNASKVDLVVSSAGLAACALAALQFLAFELHGDGSPYAIKKHMFIVVTVAMMNGVRLVGALISKWDMKKPWLVACAAPLVAAYVSTWPLHDFTIPLAPTVRAFAQAREIATYQFRGITSENTVSDDRSLPLLSNALISRVAFNHQLNYQWWISGMKITDGVQYAMVRRTPASDKNCGPIYAWTAKYAVVDSSCATKYPVGDPLSFIVGGNGWQYARDGWSVPDALGTWTLGDVGGKVVLPLSANSKGPFDLDIDGYAFISPKHPNQIIDVEVNGTKVAQWEFSEAAPTGKKEALIPENLVKDGNLTIVFKAPDAVSPAKLGMSADARVLGLGIKTIILRDPSIAE